MQVVTFWTAFRSSTVDEVDERSCICGMYANSDGLGALGFVVKTSLRCFFLVVYLGCTSYISCFQAARWYSISSYVT